MNSLALDLVESEVKILLESLTEKEQRMAVLCETSHDEDLIADVGNDLIELRLLLNSLRKSAIEKFGSSVLNFSTEPL